MYEVWFTSCIGSRAWFVEHLQSCATATTDGKQRAEWVQLRKGVAYLFRYREVPLQANARLLPLT